MGSESVGQDILISGRIDMNRAMEGDVVAGKLGLRRQWLLLVAGGLLLLEMRSCLGRWWNAALLPCLME